MATTVTLLKRLPVLATIFLSLLEYADAGNPIPIHDEHILCFGRPPDDDAGWPAGYSQSQYRDAMAFCSAAYGLPQHNLGCICPAAHVPPICSQANGADPTLLGGSWTNPDVFSSSTSMLYWCLGSCSCYDFGSTGNPTNQTSSQQTQGQNQPAGDPNAAPGVNVPNTNVGQPNTGGGVRLGGVPAGGLNAGNVAAEVQGFDQCGQDCKVGDDCKGGSCLCQAQSSRYEPSSGVLQYLAKCIYVSSSGKREEPLPCPCNSTYVSHACCDARDGRVWESPDLKLGELVEDEL